MDALLALLLFQGDEEAPEAVQVANFDREAFHIKCMCFCHSPWICMSRVRARETTLIINFCVLGRLYLGYRRTVVLLQSRKYSCPSCRYVIIRVDMIAVSLF